MWGNRVCEIRKREKEGLREAPRSYWHVEGKTLQKACGQIYMNCNRKMDRLGPNLGVGCRSVGCRSGNI